MAHRNNGKIIMAEIVNVNAITAKTENEIHAQVISELNEKGYYTANTTQELSSFFKEIGSDDDYIYSDIEQTFNIFGDASSDKGELFDEKGNHIADYQPTYKVTIKSFYKDAGSIDYCYMVDVIEL